MNILVLKKLFFRPTRHTLVLTLFSLIGSLLILASSCALESSDNAVRQSIAAQNGGRQYILESGNSSVASIMKESTNAFPVWSGNGSISANTINAPVSVSAVSTRMVQLGVRIKGMPPSVDGDATVSKNVADAAHLSLGQYVFLDGTPINHLKIHITGVVVDPMDDSSARVNVISKSLSDQANRWISDTDFYSIGNLRTSLDTGVASYQSQANLLDKALRSRLVPTRFSRDIPRAALVVFISFLILGLVSGLEAWNKEVKALCASGMTRIGAWSSVVGSTAMWVLGAFLLGSVNGPLLVWLFKGEVSSMFGQDWVRIKFPIRDAIIFLIAVLVVHVVGIFCLPWIQGYEVAQDSPVSRRVARITRRLSAHKAWPFLSVLFAGDLLYWMHLSSSNSRSSSSPTQLWIVTILTCCLLTALLWLVLGIGIPRGLRSFYQNFSSELAVSIVIITAISMLGSLWSLSTVESANQAERRSSPGQPAGSLVAGRVPDSQISDIRKYYQELGGSDISYYEMPNENTSNTRVIAFPVFDCLKEHGVNNPNDAPEECWERSTSQAPMNTVAIIPQGNSLRLDPSLASRMNAGLVTFSSRTGKVLNARVVSGTVDNELGGQLPGLAIPENIARQAPFGLVPSGSSFLLFKDYHKLSPSARLKFRSKVILDSPSTEISDSLDPTPYDLLRSFSMFIELLVSSFCSVLVAGVGMSVIQGRSGWLKDLRDLGASNSIRFSMAVRFGMLFSISSFGSALIAIRSTGHQIPVSQLGGIGLIVWCAPILVSVPVGVWLTYSVTRR